MKAFPINEWEHLSEKARSRDTYFKSCGHMLWRIPYTIDYLLKSKETLQCVESCDSQVCEALDQYECELDILYMSKCQPPNVKPVNKNGALVLDQNGVLQGPYTHFEWFSYSLGLWDKFHSHLNNDIPINSTNISELWAQVYFRNTEDFVAGNYNFYARHRICSCN